MYRARRKRDEVFQRGGQQVVNQSVGTALSAVDYNSTDVEQEFDDPFYPQQWYLHNSEHGLNVLSAWRSGWTGQGIILSVLDDGILHSNLDISPNYAPEVSCDLSDFKNPDSDPSPEMADGYHGTYCAAIVAGAANNSYCGVGVAYKARVGGVRLLQGPVTDIQEAMALTYKMDMVDVYTASWGPHDDGRTVDGPGHLSSLALRKGVQMGRGGKGVIYVWAVGNGGLSGDDCNLDGYASSIFTISVNALTRSGLSCFYDEPCASTLASAHVGGYHKKAQWKARRNFPKINVVVPELHGQCRNTFQGTSAAAPLAAGVIALVLQANPKLTWRDVQHLVVHTSRKQNTDRGWATNGAGFAYHPIYGFGSIDAGKMVQAALQWTNMNPQCNVSIPLEAAPRNVSAYSNTSLPIFVPRTSVESLEHAVITLLVRHPHRGLLELFLQSPAGTSSQLLSRRPKDESTAGFKDWPFVSVHFWGEPPCGVWNLVLVNHSNSPAMLQSGSLTLYGPAKS